MPTTTYTFTADHTSAVLRGAIEHGACDAEAIVAAVAACAAAPGHVETIFAATHDRDTRSGTVMRALRFGVSEDGSWRFDDGAGVDGPGSHQLARADASTALVCASLALRVAWTRCTIFRAL